MGKVTVMTPLDRIRYHIGVVEFEVKSIKKRLALIEKLLREAMEEEHGNKADVR